MPECPFIKKVWYHGSLEKEDDYGSLVIQIENDDGNYYYEYEEVPSGVVEELDDSYRSGTVFNNKIKGNFEEERIETENELTAKII